MDRALLVFLACSARHNGVPCTCKNMKNESLYGQIYTYQIKQLAIQLAKGLQVTFRKHIEKEQRMKRHDMYLIIPIDTLLVCKTSYLVMLVSGLILRSLKCNEIVIHWFVMLFCESGFGGISTVNPTPFEIVKDR